MGNGFIARLRRVSAAAILASAGTFGGVVGATSLQPLDLEALTDASDAVVAATLVSVHTENTNGNVQTVYQFAATEPLMGQTDSTFLVKVDGGVSQQGKFAVTRVVAGSPIFFLGRDSVLFLEQEADGSYHIAGFNQGQMAINASGKVTLPNGSHVSVNELRTMIAQ